MCDIWKWVPHIFDCPKSSVPPYSACENFEDLCVCVCFCRVVCNFCCFVSSEVESSKTLSRIGATAWTQMNCSPILHPRRILGWCWSSGMAGLGESASRTIASGQVPRAHLQIRSSTGTVSRCCSGQKSVSRHSCLLFLCCRSRSCLACEWDSDCEDQLSVVLNSDTPYWEGEIDVVVGSSDEVDCSKMLFE